MAVLYILRKLGLDLSKHPVPHGDSNAYQDEDSDAQPYANPHTADRQQRGNHDHLRQQWQGHPRTLLQKHGLQPRQRPLLQSVLRAHSKRLLSAGRIIRRRRIERIRTVIPLQVIYIQWSDLQPLVLRRGRTDLP